ncbi:MAG: nucleotidyltransferase substrate binding protein [Mariprofundaceae bacterium]
MSLNLQPLQRALTSLEEALKNPNVAADDLLRDGCIQRFEYTYELCVKMLKRLLKEMESPEHVERLMHRDMIRLGADKGLIAEPQAWFVFREKRNITSQTYNEAKAREIFGVIPEFAEHAGDLLNQLQGYG